jgi:hypothetical protein
LTETDIGASGASRSVLQNLMDSPRAYRTQSTAHYEALAGVEI